MSEPVREQPIRVLALAGVFGGLFLGYTGLTAVIPVLPGFVSSHLGATDLAVGLVVTATALTALLTRPIAGRLADSHGYRPVMAVGALIIGGGGLLYFAPLGVAGLIAVRLVLGVGEAALFTAGAAWTVSLTPHGRRGQLIGLYGVSMWGGISLGTLAGASLRHIGFGAVWTFSAALPFGLILISLVPEPERPRREAGERPALRGYGLLPRPVVLPGTALALAAAGYAGLASFVVLFLKSRGIGGGVYVLSEYGAVYAGTRLVIGHFPDKFGPRRVAAASGAGEAAGLLIIATAHNLPVALAGGLVMGVGFSLLYPCLALMALNRTDHASQGAALGAYTSFWDLGLGVWGPLTGIVASAFGYSAVFVAGASCAAVAALMAFWIDRPARYSRRRSKWAPARTASRR